ARPLLLAAADDDGLLLALPVVQARRVAKVPVPALRGWDHDYAFLGAPLVAPGRAEQAWTAALRDLRTRTPVLVLPDLPADGPAAAGLDAAVGHLGLVSRDVSSHERAVVRRRPRPDYLEGRLRGAHLKNLRRLRRVLARTVGADVVTVDRSGDPEALEAFLALEASGWKGRAGTAMASRPGHADLLRAVLDDDPTRTSVLCLQAGGRVLAAQVGLRAGRTLSCFKIAYDEAFAACSPGLLLEVDALTAFHDDPDLDVMDSCAVAGHEMAERLFPDRLRLRTVAVGLTPLGRAAVAAVPAAERVWSTARRSRTVTP
ncbi:MAG: hypothetical protein JWN17_4, partial [Frankiales bacterium]|nr:hypothetical protein [Frankiales bacterium]